MPLRKHVGPVALATPSLISHGATIQDATSLEIYRLQYHFSPTIHWMHDPIGMVYYDGEYHLFCQHNPGHSIGAT